MLYEYLLIKHLPYEIRIQNFLLRNRFLPFQFLLLVFIVVSERLISLCVIICYFCVIVFFIFQIKTINNYLKCIKIKVFLLSNTKPETLSHT